MKEMDYAALRGKKTLVTGATGFIGTHLCEKLVSHGCDVTGVSRKKPDKRLKSGINYHYEDLTNNRKVLAMVAAIQPDFIFHLAGQPVGSRSVKFVPSTLKNNLISTVNLLVALAEQKSGKLILAGSLEEPEINAAEAVPSSPYAMSKWAASRYAKMFHTLYHTQVIHLRLFMVYGPGKQDENKLIPYVIQSLLNNEPPELTSGTREIDWVYIDDVIEGIIRSAIADQIDGQTIDLGSGNLVTTQELVQKISTEMHSETQLLFGSRKDRKMEQVRRANIENTYEKINWRPRVSLEEGLARTIDYFQKQHQVH